jgi:hypothetical protein
MPGRRIRGERSFARIIKQLPDDVADEIRKQMNATGKMLLARAQSKVPVYSGKKRKGLPPGALKSGLSYRVPPKRLSLKVGLVGKAVNKKLFYGYLVEHGHRIGFRGNTLEKQEKITATGIRGRLLRARRRRDVRLNGVPPHPFLYTVSREEIYGPFRKIWGRALQRAVAGASDD